jgi:hypothetical protein
VVVVQVETHLAQEVLVEAVLVQLIQTLRLEQLTEAVAVEVAHHKALLLLVVMAVQEL